MNERLYVITLTWAKLYVKAIERNRVHFFCSNGFEITKGFFKISVMGVTPRKKYKVVVVRKHAMLSVKAID